MYLHYLVKMKHHISHFYNALLEYYPLHQVWCETVHQVQRKQTESHKLHSKYPALTRTQAFKRVGHWSTASSISDYSKPRTHAADTFAAHQSHECDTDVIFMSHVKFS